MMRRNYDSKDTKDKSDPVRVNPLFAPAFARIFGKEESKNLTRGLINAVLNAVGIEPIGEIEHIEAEHSVVEGSVDCKAERFDVRVISANHAVDLEAQRYNADIDSRALLYGAALLTEQTSAGVDYVDIPHVIMVMLLDANMKFPETEEIVSTCGLYWKSGDDLTPGSDKLTFVLIELSKFSERYNGNESTIPQDELSGWLYLLTDAYKDKDKVEAMAKQFPTMEEFAKMYGIAIDDPTIKRKYENAIYAEREKNSMMRMIRSQAAELAREDLAEDSKKIAEELSEKFGGGKQKWLQERLEKWIQDGLEKRLQKWLQKEPQEGLEEELQKWLQKEPQENSQEKLKEALEEVLEKWLQEGSQKWLQKWLQEESQKGLQKGLQEGLQEGKQQAVLSLFHDGAIAAEAAANCLGVSLAEFNELAG